MYPGNNHNLTPLPSFLECHEIVGMSRLEEVEERTVAQPQVRRRDKERLELVVAPVAARVREFERGEIVE